ncbi:kinase-like protein [Schizopora paradoxa]|uniref:Kinase-like protein n=1 Tax=Schizopora paradoxa TaxID=27342 RepID=A0A0H2R209_9AGAM|nr:kinase-like protein [Schizopora paradoxa]
MSSHGENDSGSGSISKSSELKDIFKTIRDLNLEGQMVGEDTEQVSWGASCGVFRDKQVTSQGQTVQVAVKRIRFFLLDDISFARNLHREVRLWSKLNHPNVLPLRGYFLEGKKAIPNLVSEWMERGTIIDYMKDRPFDSHEICTMVYGIASGLHYIHTEHSMVHADLKGV